MEEADAKALTGGRRPSLRAVEGFPGVDLIERAMTADEAAQFRPAETAAHAERVNPKLTPNNPAFHGDGRYGAPPSPAANAPAAPVAAPAKASTLRNAASAVGNGILYGGAALGGAAVARGMSGVGAGGPSVAVPGERQAGDSANSVQIPIGGNSPAPDAQPYNFWTGSEAGRNIGNAANAIAPLGGVAMAARVPGAASKAFGVADAALGGLSAGIHNERASANTATSAATTLRTRPEDTFAGPPVAAAGAASPATDPGAPRRVDRPGQSPLFTNVADDAPYIGNNALMARGNGPSAQNMAAANNLAATDSLRSQGAALGGQLAGGSGIPAMPQTLHSGNDWASRKNLENLRTSAGSIYDSQSQWGNKAKAAADVGAFQNAQAMDTAARTGSDPGSISRNSAQASMFGSKTAADASRYGSDNSLRGQMYSSDAQLGAKRMEMQRGLQQQQLKGAIFREAGGKPEVAAQIAASYGLDPKDFTDMASASQTRAKANSEDAQSTFKGMFLDKDGKPDAGGEAMAHHAASQIVPGWENMSQEQRNAARPRVVEYVNMLQQANNNRDTGWLQKAGITKSSDMRSQMPDMTGATLSDVGWWEGATTPNIGRGDKKVTLKSGAEMHFDSLNEAQKRLLEINGVRQQK